MTVKMTDWNHYTPLDHTDDESDCVFTLRDGSQVTLTRKQMQIMAAEGEVDL